LSDPDIERAADRWRLVEAWWGPQSVGWQATVDDADTGRWHTLAAYTDLTAARPALPPGQSPALRPWPPGVASADGALAWGELLAVADGAAADPRWELARLRRGARDPERYGALVVAAQPGMPTYRAHWIATYADWARLRDGAGGGR